MSEDEAFAAAVAKGAFAGMNKPAYERKEELAEGVTLYLGDCRDILPGLGPVDHIITDPPFSENTHAGHNGISSRTNRTALSYGSISDADAEQLAALFATSSAGWVVWFTDHHLAPSIRAAMKATGRAVFAPLPFIQPGRSVRLSGDGPSSWTDWMVCARTSALKKWGTLPGGYIAGEGWKDKEHMGGKPLKLMLAVVNDYSRPGDLVCDPCLGGGTTLVACIRLGRRGVGIERDPATFDKACRRISAALKEPDMFIEHYQPMQLSILDEDAA